MRNMGAGKNSVMMHLAVYLMLLAGPCLAHYRFEPRNLVERDELQDKGEWVDCPVCEIPSYSPLSSREVCEMHEGRPAKLCRYGTYINEVCGSRRDCYRGPSEPCTEKMDNDPLGWQCAPGYHCSYSEGRCMGIGHPYPRPHADFVAESRYKIGKRRDM